MCRFDIAGRCNCCNVSHNLSSSNGPIARKLFVDGHHVRRSSLSLAIQFLDTGRTPDSRN